MNSKECLPETEDWCHHRIHFIVITPLTVRLLDLITIVY